MTNALTIITCQRGKACYVCKSKNTASVSVVFFRLTTYLACTSCHRMRTTSTARFKQPGTCTALNQTPRTRVPCAFAGARTRGCSKIESTQTSESASRVRTQRLVGHWALLVKDQKYPSPKVTFAKRLADSQCATSTESSDSLP